MACFTISLQLLPLVLFSPLLWMGVVLVAAVALVAKLVRPAASVDLPTPGDRRWVFELCALLLMPVLLLACCEYFGSPRPPVPHQGKVLMALHGTVFIQTVLAAWLTWRHRGRLLPTFLIAELGIWWGVATFVLAGMAVTGNWL